jgi:hypothetical protein
MYRPLSAIFRRNTTIYKEATALTTDQLHIVQKVLYEFWEHTALVYLKRDCEVPNRECNHLIFNIKMLKCGC